MMMESLPPAPRFDRFAVHDLRVFGSIKKLREDEGSWGDPYERSMLGLTGIPVVVDEGVEVGVIELRKGDEVVDRFTISELRA
jgi:hypothetical protein